MAQPIAKIRLALGNVGFYDSLTGVRLTKAEPEGIIYSGKNTANIKKAIKEGKVVLKEGSLSSLQNEPVLKREMKNDKPKQKKATKEIKKETKPVEKIEKIEPVSVPVTQKKQEIVENQNQIKKLAVNTAKNKKEEKPDTNNVSENKKEDKKE